MANVSYRKFYKKEKKQIYAQNINIIKGLSKFYITSLILFAIIGFFIFSMTDRFILLLMLFGLMMILMIGMYLVADHIEKKKYKDLKKSVTMTYLSMTFSMIFIIIISTLIAREETRASFFLVFNIVLPSLFMLNKKEIIASELLAIVVFLILSSIFRNISFLDDIYIALGSLIIGVPYNMMIYSMKMGDAYTKKKYADQANLDILTGLPNRRAFNSRIDDLFLETAYKTMLFIIIDIDNFKQMNDKRGHAFGDYAIQTLATSLEHYSKENQLFVSRIGGDEFVLIALDIPIIQIKRILTEISDTIKQIKLDKDEKLYLSMGAFYFNEPGKYTPEEVFKKADEALYDVKAQNKGDIKLIIDQEHTT